VQDLVTPWQVSRPPRGFSYTVVNGRLAFAQGSLTGVQAGAVLRA
jgi:hypothetical protein